MNFEIEAYDFADVMTKEEWEEQVSYGVFVPYDGNGYWGTETHFSRKVHCWQEAPEGATHVHWFNK